MWCASLEWLSGLPKPVVIFLDALDQLRNPGWLGWFPQELPTGVKLVVSVLDDPAYKTGSEIYEGLQQRLPKGPFPNGAFLEIEPLAPHEGRDILRELEKEAQHGLRDGQRDYIIRQFQAADASPLWLRTAFEIARSWKSRDKPGEGRHVLIPDSATLIAKFIDNLTDVHHHARELVTHTFGYLTAAKDGLSTKELTEVLLHDVDVTEAISFEHARTKTLPPSVWVRLNRQLGRFLTEKRIDDQPLLQFFHRQVADVARERHYEATKIKLHTALAAYFDTRGIEREGSYDKRSLSELPFQLHHAENDKCRARLYEILMWPGWMRQKLDELGPRRLIGDYQYARTRAQKLTGQTLELAAGALARDERQLAPQMVGRIKPELGRVFS